MTILVDLRMSDLNERKALGQEYLASHRIREAQSVYLSLLQEYPQEGEVYYFLGECSLSEGDIETAILLYTQALKFDPDNQQIKERRTQAISKMVELLPTGAQQGGLPGEASIEDEMVPTDPQAIAGLLQRLSGLVEPISEADLLHAANVLEKVISSPRPAQAVAEYLDEIDTLLPALLELNIRQARADGHPELAQALQKLLNNVHLQMNGFTERSVGKPASSVPQALRILFIGPANQPASLRQLLPAEALSAYGHEVTVATRFPADPQEHFDLVVAHNPHGDPHLLHGLATCAAAHIPIVVDLDADFEQMPITHPDYATLSLGTPPRAKAFTAALLLADRVCVPNENLAASLRASGYQVEVIPEGWNQANPLWQKPPPRRHSLNLGWIGQPGQLEDMAMIRRYVTRIMREFSHVNLVIVGDIQVYQLFDSLPEARRLFLPPVNLEDYPYLYGQIDILLVPLRNTPFNNSQTDRQLMEAGVRQIPWVASPLPEYVAWGVGELIANEPDDWHTYLRQLINNSALRIKLGKAGRMKAEEREMDHLGKAWLKMITQCAFI